MRILKVFVFVTVFACSVFPNQDSVKNVIIVVIDGLRYSEGLGAGPENMPRLYNDLMPTGAVVQNFYNLGTTLTSSGHSSLATGTWQHLANDGSERPSQPVWFEYFRKWRGYCAEDCFIVTGKPKLASLAYSRTPGFGPGFSASEISNADFPDSLDEQVWNNLQAVMDEFSPKLIMVNFPAVDVKGHSGDWDAYLSAIRIADSLVYCLWQKIQSSPGYKDHTLLFITSDHGRHDYDKYAFAGHGDGCEGCRRIFLVALGPYLKKNYVGSVKRSQIDVFPTIAELMGGFEKPQYDGIAMRELFNYNFKANDGNANTQSGNTSDGLLQKNGILFQNYPNPFNPETFISYELCSEGVPSESYESNARIIVYDMLGKIVAKLVDTKQKPGKYHVKFNSTGLSSGMYFYELTAGNSRQVKKMIINK